MESFEYFRATSSPVPELQSPTWARSSTPRSSIAARGTDVELPGLCAAWDSGSLLDDSATSSELDHSGSPPGSYVFAAEEQFMGEATVAIRHSGWLLKASGKGPHRKWHKQWVYLKDDRLCYTPDPGGSEGVRYIALDRIPLRPLPRGYGPKIGITIVDSRQLDTSSAAVRGKRAGCIFSVACGSHTHFWAADTPASAKDWVEQITRAWSRCVKHVARGTHSPGADELLAMREAKWRAENEALRKSLAEADKLRHAAQSSEQWRVLLEAEKKQESIQELVKYNVQVVTGSCKGAGTSSQVYIEVYDKAGRSSGEHQLVVRVYHDNTGTSPSWYLEELRVRRAASNGEWTVFPCQRWLAVDVEDGRVMRDLQPGCRADLVTYRVTATTTDLRGADTTANVYITLHGSRGDSQRHALATGPHNFERGSTDAFAIQDRDLGMLEAVTIGHDGTGLKPAWHLQQVSVINSTSGQEWLFPCRQWFDADSGDRNIERRLQEGRGPPEPCWYTVVVCTSDVRGAGTTSEAGDFERGHEDVFRVQLPRVGRLQSLTVGQNCTGASPDWHLEQVEVTDEQSGETSYFGCNNWLSSRQGDGLAERTLVASSTNPRDQLATYRLELHTSDLRAAGTSACVWVQLHGAAGSSDVQKVQGTPKSYQRGAVDTHAFTCGALGDLRKLTVGHDGMGDSPSWHLQKLTEMDVGELQHLRIWHDNSGPASSWALDFIELTKGSEAPVYFTCHDWLAEPAYQKVLMPTLADPRTAMITYELAVRTADMKGAGTDSNLRFILHGASRSSHVIPLPTGPGAFERGKVDHFRFRLPTVGNLQRLELLSDGSGQNPGWFCDSVSVTESSTGTATYFLCNRWLDSKHGLQVHLEGSSRNPELDYTSYQLDLDTSDIPQSSTDGDVYIELKGSTGSSGWQKVVPAAKVSSLDRGQKASAELRLRGLGSLQQASLRLENATCGWHLEAVTISDGATGDRWYLPCHAWFTQKHGMEHTLTAFKASDVAEYRMRLHTSDTPVAGTSARVSVELVGRAGKTSKIWLGPGATLPGQTAEHLVSWGALGDLQQLVIGHDGSSTSPSWHLDYAEVVQPPAGQVIFFDCNQWLSREHGDGCLERTLHASTADPSLSRCSYKELHADIGAFTRLSIQVEDASSKAQWHLASVEVQNEKTGQRGLFVGRQWVTSSSSTILSPSESAELDDVEYEVTVHTSDVRGAATDAEVLLELHGSQGASGALRLPSTPSSFKRAAADSFNLLAADCGELQELHIWHTGKRSGGWHCEYVELTNKSSGSTWFFVCRDWVADGQHKVLPASSKDPRLDEVTYKVVVYTSDVKGAGTDASVFLELKGDQHCSGPVVLSSSDSSAFERGQVDTFTLRLPRLGEVVEALVGHDGKGKRPSWHLDCIEVREVEAGHVWYFKCGEWLRSEGTGAVQKVLKAQPDNPRDSLVKYVVKTFTSDLRGAGTDACVLIQLFGTSGQTDRLQLSGDQVAFERGQQNEFTVKADGLGQLRKIWIGHDNEEDTFAAQVSLVDYELTIKTGDVRNAGTDADVSVSIVGSSGSSGVQKLQAGAGAFRRGSVDSFRLRLPALGTLQQLELSRTAEGQQQGWFVDWVKIIERSSGQETYFFAKAWLDDSHGLAAVLKPGQGQRFKVFVHTSNISDAGTDCGLLITFHGDKGSSGQLPLSSKTAALDPGTANEFQIETQEGSCKSWHCASIEVGSTLDGSLVAFPCDSWFGKGKGDGLVERDLYPEGSPQAMVQVPYKISIHTSGDEPAAGMRRGVGLELHGSANVAGPIMLDNDGAYFGQGSVDTFKVQAADVGSLQQLRIWVDSPGDATSRWFLDMVEVTNEDLGQTAYFVCRRWLDRRNGYEVTLPASSSNPRLQDTDYKVCIYTSSFSGAETSGNVIINIIGQKRESGVLTLRNKAGMSFRSGKVDIVDTSSGTTYFFPAECWVQSSGRAGILGQTLKLKAFTTDPATLPVPYQVIVTVDDVKGVMRKAAVALTFLGTRGNTEEDCSCLLSSIELINQSSGDKAVFACGEWLHSGDDFDLEFWAGEAPKEVACSYRCELQTSDLRKAGTTGHVYLTIIGERERIGTYKLSNPSGDHFQRGQLDVFQISNAPDIGQLRQIEVRHDGQKKTAWHLAFVKVANQQTGAVAMFNCNRWIDKQTGDPEVVGVVVAMPSKPDLQQPLANRFALKDKTVHMAAAGRGTVTFQEGTKKAPSDLPLQEQSGYKVAFHTSRGCGSGTNSKVHFELLGSRDSSGVIMPVAAKRSFKPGRVDVFTFLDMPYLGDLQAIKVGTDGTGLFPGWHLRQVDVTHLPTEQRWVFACYNWLDKSCNYYRWLQLDGGEIKTAKGVEQLQPVRSPGARQESQQQQQQQQKQRAGGSPSASQRLVPGMSGRATSSPMRRSPGRLAPQLFEADFDGMRSPMIGARW
ncbi:hypothetical protein N2152v2_008932 [Parachlorella kessleri]